MVAAVVERKRLAPALELRVSRACEARARALCVRENDCVMRSWIPRYTTTVLWSLAALLCFAPLLGQAADLEIEVTGLRSRQGTLRFALYNHAATFLKNEGRLARLKVPVQGNPMHVRFPNLPPGLYAVTVYHDEDDDGKLDRTLLGIPTEGYGFSNDVHVLLGPPSFTAAAVMLGAEDKGITITMRY